MAKGKSLVVIPARLASKRLPGKVLEKIGDKSVLQWVVSKVMASQANAVWVATEDQEIRDHLGKLCPVFLTGQHPNGTFRVAEVARQAVDFDIIINVQGDEPFVNPSVIDHLIEALHSTESDIATVVTPFHHAADLFDYNRVKVVMDAKNNALYFSRQAIPGHRDLPYHDWLSHTTYYQHVGIYGFKREVLPMLVHLPEAPLERTESLEQLRWLYHGYDIHCLTINEASRGIDTIEDLEWAREHYKHYI